MPFPPDSIFLLHLFFLFVIFLVLLPLCRITLCICTFVFWALSVLTEHQGGRSTDATNNILTSTHIPRTLRTQKIRCRRATAQEKIRQFGKCYVHPKSTSPWIEAKPLVSAAFSSFSSFAVVNPSFGTSRTGMKRNHVAGDLRQGKNMQILPHASYTWLWLKGQRIQRLWSQKKQIETAIN